MNANPFLSDLNPNEQLRNVAQTVLDLTEVQRRYNGRGRCATYNGDVDAIAGAARQLADMVLDALQASEATARQQELENAVAQFNNAAALVAEQLRRLKDDLNNNPSPDEQAQGDEL